MDQLESAQGSRTGGQAARSGLVIPGIRSKGRAGATLSHRHSDQAETHYVSSLNGIAANQLRGFFDGWPNPPSPQTHLRLLSNSDEIVLGIDDSTGNVVGFITAITDRVLAAYIPLLEVVPAYRGRGIGRELVRRMLKRLEKFHRVDLLCDSSLESFYSRLGMTPSTGMMIRRYERQDGAHLSA